MKDYRLPRTGKGRAASRTLPLPGFITGIKNFLLKLGILIVLIVLTIGSISFVLFKVFFPRLVDLSIDTTVVIVPAAEELSSQRILIAEYDAKSQTVTTTKLDTTEEVDVIGGFGAYPLKSVYPLLKMEDKDADFIRAAYGAILGQVVDGIIESDEGVLVSGGPQLASVLSRDLLKHPLNLWSNKQQVQLMSVAGKLAQSQLTQQEMKSLEEWQRYTQRQASAQPDTTCPVAVVNTTPTGGVASHITRLVEGSGYTVIRIADSAHNFEHSRVVIDAGSEVCGIHGQRLTHLLPQGAEVVTNTEQAQSYRAKIVVLLGQDVSQVLEN